MVMEFEDRYLRAEKLQYDCLLFDLDDTLYPLSSGIAAHCKNNIRDYMAEKLGIDEGKASELAIFLYKKYGTTMAGLKAIGYTFNYDDYHSYAHGRLPYDKLKPDPVLRQLLMSIPIRKVIFTNADKIHAAKVLNRLGLEDCFEGIICFETLNPADENPSTDKPVSNIKATIFDIMEHCSSSEQTFQLPDSPILCKPSASAMKLALDIAKIEPRTTIFFDDSIRNIEAGKKIGLHTVLVVFLAPHNFSAFLFGWLRLVCVLLLVIKCFMSIFDQVGTSQRVKGADHALESIHNIREALPMLWEGEKTRGVGHGGKVAIEMHVYA